MSTIGNSQLHPRLVKVPWKCCIIDDLKFLNGIRLLVGRDHVSDETENGSESYRGVNMGYSNKSQILSN